jgi:hypothetical protein
MTVRAVIAEAPVRLLKCGTGANGNGFLADA